MSDLTLYNPDDASARVLPQPRVAVTVREAVMRDVSFIDRLQKKHSKMVGWFPTKQIEANIAGGHVLIAEHVGTASHSGERRGAPVGYCIARDKYMKREDCGIVYQLNVSPGDHRKLVGASLVKAVFDRAAYGCRLFCCWCAQDIEANHFWESIGFVPLAFRTGSRGRGNREPRIHIFWQRRIRDGDDQTPYWFPSETTGGAVKENRLVLPIPPGTHWSDAKPAVLPGMEEKLLSNDTSSERAASRRRRPRKNRQKVQRPKAKPKGGLWFAPAEASQNAKTAAVPDKPTAEKKPKQKNDPKLVAAVRDLRDRYLEQANEAGSGLLPGACGKYDVSRVLDTDGRELPLRQVQQRQSMQPGDEGRPMLDAA